MRVLIIEDHQDLAENIGDYLSAAGHITDFAMDGIGGLHLALTNEYDVVVLDLMLPGMDGLTLCRKLRQEADRQVPVLMLTARDTLQDKLTGFESGADDYLVKPFALEELGVRVRALAKRSVPAHRQTLRVADLTLDLGAMTVSRAENAIELNRVCLQILEILMTAHPNVVTRHRLENALWGDEPPGSDALRSHIYTLRNKIDKPFSFPILETIHGIGYKLNDNNETQ
ncbi:MAG: response regulator transcription factor [Proteobacteria bacterium]|nr:response regulator transcription factor [Pseudomonadota bacterium]